MRAAKVAGILQLDDSITRKGRMSALLTRPGRIELFAHGRQVELTPRVASFCETTEAEARAWAYRHRVSRSARAYLWTISDVKAFLQDLASQHPPGNDAA